MKMSNLPGDSISLQRSALLRQLGGEGQLLLLTCVGCLLAPSELLHGLLLLLRALLQPRLMLLRTCELCRQRLLALNEQNDKKREDMMNQDK